MKQHPASRESKLRRIGTALLLSLPGLTLAMLAKPLLMGDAALLVGLLLAFGLPIYYLSARPSRH